MKFYSYTNENKSYTKALTLLNVRSVKRYTGTGKSAIRFGVTLTYLDGTTEHFDYLHEDESKKLYKELVDLLNKEEE